MPLKFLNYTKVLSTLIIPDLMNIIISYTSNYVEIFDEKFISECIKTGHYLYYNKNNTTLIHHLLQKERLDDIKDLFVNSKYLRVEHFQNKDKYNRTELYWLCYNNMHETIIRIKNWKPEHVKNKNRNGKTELYWLCKYKMHKIIALITSNFIDGDHWKPKHF